MISASSARGLASAALVENRHYTPPEAYFRKRALGAHR